MRVRVLVPAALALLLGGCSTLQSVGRAIASPVTSLLGLEPDCEDQPHTVPPPATVYGRLRLGSWNVHYLGPSEETPDERRDPRLFAETIRASGVSVLALQEVGVQDARRPRSVMLDAIFAELAKDGADWRYRLYGNEKDLTQFTGIAWDRRVLQETAEPVALELKAPPPSLLEPLPLPAVPGVQDEVDVRGPFAVKLSAGPGKTDIVLLPVHLSARVEHFPIQDAAARRTKEMDTLTGYLPDVIRAMSDRDLVVLGDFNTELGTEGAAASLLEHGWRDLNCDHTATYLTLPLPLDRVFVPRDQPEFALAPNFALVPPPRGMEWSEFRERVSDHALVVAEVLVTADDD